MKRTVPGGKGRSKPQLRSRKPARGEQPPSVPASSTNVASAGKRTHKRRSTPELAHRSGAYIRRRRENSPQVRLKSIASRASASDTSEAAELTQLYQSHLARVIDLTEITWQVLLDCYAYDPEDPLLWQCCNLVGDILKRAQGAFTHEGIVAHEAAPLQQEWLRPAVQVVRVTECTLRGVKPNYQPEVLPALRDVERGIVSVLDLLDRLVQVPRQVAQ